MWRRVSVFAGSFDLDAAEAVCAGEGIAAGQIADLIDALVAKSILSRSTGPGEARYRLLDTVGEFGLHKLRAGRGERGLRLRHRDWYAALAARQEAFGPGRAQWLTALDTDHENLRAALEFSVSAPQEVGAGAELACDLWWYWSTHGHIAEGRRILAALLDKLDEPAAVRRRALWVAGYLAQFHGDFPAARALLEAALSAARSAGDVGAEAWASSFLGWDLFYFGDAETGDALAQTALRLHRESGDQVGLVCALAQIGYMQLCAGEAQAATDTWGECARVCESSGNVWYHAYAQWGLGVAALLRADYDSAAGLECAALSTMRHMDDPMGVVLSMDALAWVNAAQKRAVQAATLLGAAEAVWAAIPAIPAPPLREHHDTALAAAREALPAGTYRDAFAKGHALSQAEAIAFALGESSPPAPRLDDTRGGAGPPQLTRREQDVAALVTRGMSNSQIAATLVISARTVETHVQHIMDKLGVSTRAQIAAWSTAQPQASPTPETGGHTG